MKKFLSVIFALFFLSSCVGIHSSNFQNVVSSSGKTVVVETSEMGILSLTVPDVKKLELSALNKLKAKGVQKNITTRLEMRNFIFIQFYKMVATGEK